VQLVELLPGLDEGFLRDVFAGLYVAGDRQCDRGHRVLAGQYDAAIGLLAAAGGCGQFTVQRVDQQRGHGVGPGGW